MAAVHPDPRPRWDGDDSAELNRLIADTIPQLVWATAPNGDADYFNARLLHYTGLRAEQLEGQGWRTIIHPEDSARVESGWKAAAAAGERYIMECRLRRADGAYRWHHVAALPLRADGEIVRWFGTCTDIEDQVRALRESEQRFQAFMDNLPASAWIRDARSRYTCVNRVYAKLWGGDPAFIVGRAADEIYSAEAAAYFRETDEKVRRAAAPVQFVDSVPSGRWLKVKFPVPDGEGGLGVGGIAVDITEVSRLEEALRQSESRLRSFMQHVPAAAWIKDHDFRYTYVNPVYEQVYGRPVSGVLGRDDFELHPAQRAQLFRDEDQRIRSSGDPSHRLHDMPYADGRPGHWLVVKFPLADAAGETGIGGIAIDLTARMEAEEKARRYAEEVRSLVGRLVQAQEAERRRVADELHDLIGQNLTALGIDLQALKHRLQSGGDLISGPRLDAMAALLETTIDAIRGVMTDLRPVALEEFGLVPALRWYASQFAKRTGIKVTTKAPRRETRLPAETELALFRIVQEALTNAAKHSGCAAVEVKIQHGKSLRLSVEDDGSGLKEAAARAARGAGFGLTTMRERAEAQGGTLRVECPERGTRIVVEIPGPAHAD